MNSSTYTENKYQKEVQKILIVVISTFYEYGWFSFSLYFLCFLNYP